MLNRGDLVRIASMAEMEEMGYPNQENTYAINPYGISTRMEEYFGTVVTIRSATSARNTIGYSVDEDRGTYIWTEAMFSSVPGKKKKPSKPKFKPVKKTLAQLTTAKIKHGYTYSEIISVTAKGKDVVNLKFSSGYVESFKFIRKNKKNFTLVFTDGKTNISLNNKIKGITAVKQRKGEPNVLEFNIKIFK